MAQYVGPGEVYINGRVQAEAQSVDLTVDSNDSQVVTMLKGATGFSDGATTSSASITSAIPRKGFETEFVRHVVDRKEITLVVKCGQQRIKVAGRFKTSKIGQSATGTATITGDFVGGKAEIIG